LIEADDTEDATQGLMTNHADPILKYKVNKAGTYILEVTDVLGNSGADIFYLIERLANTPSFQTFVSPANLTIPKGGTALFRVDISSEDKFIPGLDFLLNGLPKGFLISSLKSQTGSKFWEISVTAPETAKEETMSLELQAQTLSKGKEKSVATQTAIAADLMMQAFYYTHHIPAAGFVAEIGQPSSFSIRLSADLEEHLQNEIPVSARDTVVSIKVRIFRAAGFTDPIELTLNKKNPLITMEPTVVLPNETEKVVNLKMNDKSGGKLRQFRLGFAIVGTVNGEIEKKGKRSFQNASFREYSPIFVLQKN
jgi:hypothetical protein